MPRCFQVVLDRYEDARRLEDFLKDSSDQLWVSLSWTGTSGLACHLRVIPLTDGDVGHYICEPMDYTFIVVTSVLAGHEQY